MLFFWKVGRTVIVFWPISLNQNTHLSTQVQCTKQNKKQNKNIVPERVKILNSR